MAGGALLATAGAGLSIAGILALKRRTAEAWFREHARLPGPAKTTGARVCIYQIGHGGEAAFAGVCNRLWREWGFERHGVRSRSELQNVLTRYPTYERLVMAAHGDPSWYFAGFGGINPEWMARQLQGRLVDNTIISLAGCRAGADPGTPQYSSVPGGQNSFAARLRDLLVRGGAPAGGMIRAHTTTGHTTENPYARTFTIGTTNVGQAGRDVELARGAQAERWILAMAGYDGMGINLNIDPINAVGIAVLVGGIGVGLYGLYDMATD